jgi:hypothetical protein
MVRRSSGCSCWYEVFSGIATPYTRQVLQFTFEAALSNRLGSERVLSPQISIHSLFRA